MPEERVGDSMCSYLQLHVHAERRRNALQPVGVLVLTTASVAQAVLTLEVGDVNETNHQDREEAEPESRDDPYARLASYPGRDRARSSEWPAAGYKLRYKLRRGM